MKVLVTGGAVFIGYHVVANLLAKGIDVFVYDLPATGSAAIPDGAVFIPGSILDVETLRVAMVGTDAVYHLAAMADV